MQALTRELARMKHILELAGRYWRTGSQRKKTIIVIVAAAVLGTLIAVPLAFASGHQATVTSSARVERTSPARATARPAPVVSLLTGLPGAAGHVLAVKIDNVGPAQFEQTGLDSADVVYAIQVEGGLSRYLAIYDSNHVPAQVGPVRSARQTDIPLLAAYGRVGLAYSGAISGLLPDLARADLQNITPADGLFSHGGTMPTYIAPSSVFAAYPQLAPAKNVGFTFGAEPAGGTPADSVTANMPAASFTFTASGTSWLVSVDGHPAVTTDQGRTTTTNVIIQHVDVLPGKYTDYNAAEPANEVFSQTTGHGTAEFYRDGKVWHGEWSKPTDTSPTSYTVNGVPMHLAPGRTWVVLVG
jgi:hypothetical protein